MATLCSSTAGVSRPGNATTEHETYIPVAFGIGEQSDVGHCLRSQASKADKHESTTYVAQPIPYRKAKRAQTEDDDETWTDDQVANTINLFDQGDIRTTHAVVQPIALAENTIGRQPLNGGNGGANPPAVAMRESGQGYWMEDQIAGTIDANMGMSGHANRAAVIKQAMMAVRRLTPVECERLQGFPDNHTLIPWRGKDASECPDGPRYKALGNSMAVPVMAWIGQRIQAVNDLPK